MPNLPEGFIQDENRRLKDTLRKIAVEEPKLNTIPLDQLGPALRRVTKLAKEALEVSSQST